MNKAILIIIGIGCALLVTAGIMQHTYHSTHKKIHICYDIEVEPIVINGQTPGWLKNYLKKAKEGNDTPDAITSTLKCTISLSSQYNNTFTLSPLPYFTLQVHNLINEPVRISRSAFTNVTFDIIRNVGSTTTIYIIGDKGDGSSLDPNYKSNYKLGDFVEIRPKESCFQGYYLEKMVTGVGGLLDFPEPGTYGIQACFLWNGTAYKSNAETIEADDRSIECSIQTDKTLYDVWDRPIITVTLKNTGIKPAEMRRNIEARYIEIRGTGYFTKEGSLNFSATHYVGKFKDGKYGLVSPLPPPPDIFTIGPKITNDEPEMIPPGQAITLTYTFCNKLVNGKPFLDLDKREISADYTHFVRAQSNKIIINVESKPEAGPDAPPIKIVDSEWGSEKNGLKSRLSSDNKSITYGEEITLSLEIINVSNYMRQYNPNSGSMLDRLIIQYQDGTSVKYIGGMYQFMYIPDEEIHRGQRIALGQAEITGAYHMCNPGKYTIQWQGGGRMPDSNKIEIDVKKGRLKVIDDIFCRLVHIMPVGWHTSIGTGTDVTPSEPGVESQSQFLQRGIVITKNGAGFILLRRGRLDADEAVEVWHTKTKIDMKKIMFWHPSGTDRTGEYLGQDKWGYAYINLFLSEKLTPEWPTAKQDIIKALEIH